MVFSAGYDLSTATPSPLSSDSFQRAVFKAAPKRFTIEFLPPTKLGSTWYYGMRIASIVSKRGSISSLSSAGSATQYDTWRTWEDCLELQNHIELEYKRAARERRTRLTQGKGVKAFNGMYKQDMASSWESLPPGPEPTSISTDVHTYLPHLTKKASFFRVKMETIERQAQELQAFVETMMSDDVPALIREMRATREVTDFFGYWRRDVDFEEKLRKHNPRLANLPRSSMSNAVVSHYFPSSASLGPKKSSSMFSSSKSKRSLSSSSTNRESVADSMMTASTTTTIVPTPSQCRSRLESGQPLRGFATERMHRRTSSSSESSAHSEEVSSDRSCTAHSSAPRIAEDYPVQHNYHPERGQPPPSPITEEELGAMFTIRSPHDIPHSIHIHRRGPSEGSDRRSKRSCQVFGSPLMPRDTSPVYGTRHELPPVRESWQTMQSADTYLDGLEFELPGVPREERASVQSFATVNTLDSALAVLPTSPRERADSYKLHMPRASVPVSLSDFDIFSESEGQLSLLNSFPRPLSHLTEESDSRPDTPTAEVEVQPPSPRGIAEALSNLRVPARELNGSTFSTPSPIPPPSPNQLPSSSSSTQQPNFPSSAKSLRFSSLSISTEVGEPRVSSPVTESGCNNDDFGWSEASSSAVSTRSFDSWGQAPSSATLSSITSPTSKVGNITLKISLGSSIVLMKVARDIPYADLRQRIYNKFVGQEGIALSPAFDIIEKQESRLVDSDFEWREISDTFQGSKLPLGLLNS